MRGMRHGYGVRTSAKFGMASHSKPNKSDIRNSLSSLGSDDAHVKVAGSAAEDSAIGSEGRDKKLDDTRGGFVLKANSDEQPSRRKTLVSKSTHSLKRTFMSVSTRTAVLEWQPRKRDCAILHAVDWRESHLKNNNNLSLNLVKPVTSGYDSLKGFRQG